MESFLNFHNHSQRKKKNQKERKTATTIDLFLPLIGHDLNYKGSAGPKGPREGCVPSMFSSSEVKVFHPT
jgi:hypothetical protein